MAGIAELYELQKYDTALGKVRGRLLQIQKLLSGTSELQDAKAAAEKSVGKLQASEIEQRDSELEAQALTARIDEANAQLMSGSITNHKELESLQASVEALRRQREGVENNSVAALEKVEKFRQEVDDRKASLNKLHTQWKQEATALKDEGNKLKKQYQLIKQKREQIASEIGDDLLNQYTQIRKRKAGIAVAVLDGDTCGACHMQVPSGVESAARSVRPDLVFCPSCGRILYGQ